jgi:hypothetical protein
VPVPSGWNISYESLRQILIKEGLHEAKKKRSERAIDFLYKCWLVAMKDDADGYVYGRFYPKGKKKGK